MGRRDAPLLDLNLTMLSTQDRELLAAYVDGELSTAEREAAHRLLQQSAEARTALQQMQQDAAALRQLPRHRLAPDFSQRILGAIAERNLRPGGDRPAAVKQFSLPAWASLAAAAAVLIAVALGSYLLSGGPVPGVKTQPEVAENRRAVQEKPGDDQFATQRATDKGQPVKRPSPRPRPSEQPAPIPKLEAFPPVAGAYFKLPGLDPDRLRQALPKDGAIRVDLAIKDGSQAVAQLRRALNSQGIQLLTDQITSNRLERAGLKTNFVLYFEDVTTDEVARVLEQLASDERHAEAMLTGSGQFSSMVVSRMKPEDRRELARLLRIDADKLEPAFRLPSLSLGNPEREPSRAGQGSDRPVSRATEHLALLMAYNPVRPRRESQQIKRFLDHRSQPRAGTVQVIVVLRDLST